jgi:hypothetical protein
LQLARVQSKRDGDGCHDVLATLAIALDPILIGGDGQGRTIGFIYREAMHGRRGSALDFASVIFRRGGRGENKTPQAENAGL